MYRVEVSFDEKADAIYIKFQNGKFFRNKKIDRDTIVDLDKKGRLLGIEFLNATERVPLRDLMAISINLPLKMPA